jgi:K+-sensing histidine kinase KdpD
LFRETRERLEELQTAQRQYLQSAWTSLATQERSEYEVGDSTAGETRMDVPLTLRDQIIGQISLAGDAEWTPEERAWVEAVATQSAVALENARLLDESQRNAAYEKLIADITGKIWSSTTIDGILQTSIRELGRTLNATEAIIELSPEEEQ